MTLRAAILVTHLLGVGHLTRAAALARAMAARGHQTILISGGNPSQLLRTDGVELVQLPPLHVVGTAFSDLRQSDGKRMSPAIAAARLETATAALQRLQPDVLITELFPFGRRALGDEFRAILDAARQLPRPPLVLASVRDILACPVAQSKIDAAHALVRQYYHGVLVHSDPQIAPLQASWPIAEDLKPLLHYTGYVDDAGAGDGLATGAAGAGLATGAAGAGLATGADGAGLATGSDGAGDVIVSGGGSAAALPLFGAALAAARLDQSHRWRLLVGHKVAPEIFSGLLAAAPANAIVELARPDFRALLRRCAVSVSQFGYNTALDILASGAPAIVVPFAEGGETEQGQRAALFAARGLVHVITHETLTPEILLAAVNAAPVRGVQFRSEPHGSARDGASPAGPTIAVDGADCSARIIAQLVAAHTAHETDATAAASPMSAPRAKPAVMTLLTQCRAALRPVDEALRRAAGEAMHRPTAHSAGEPQSATAFWWRDDDAVAPTLRLERLLALANDHDAPVAIAAIPALATPELAQFLAGDTNAAVLVHGLTHENRAPAGAKNGEFSYGAPDDLAARAAGGLAGARALFGAKTRPVLTPPWNRIDPALPPLLAGVGFTGVSTFNERTARFAAPGLIQINTHIDPVNWRGDRSLVEPGRLAADLCAAINRRAGGAARARFGPVGLLTHHLVHDARIDAFVAALLALIASHQDARFIHIDEALIV